jgi:hypothetical protein
MLAVGAVSAAQQLDEVLLQCSEDLAQAQAAPAACGCVHFDSDLGPRGLHLISSVARAWVSIFGDMEVGCGNEGWCGGRRR